MADLQVTDSFNELANGTSQRHEVASDESRKPHDSSASSRELHSRSAFWDTKESIVSLQNTDEDKRINTQVSRGLIKKKQTEGGRGVGYLQECFDYFSFLEKKLISHPFRDTQAPFGVQCYVARVVHQKIQKYAAMH